ncbi:UNVERIFIED_CONTAM: hypothetical protein Scaly_2987400 [Sesamum calycinum]|uniref:Endonuclease/exonuclease/phosphatase domain-containing protein n=1 Tax=Sesamum calycinum TaxID=2727403 RepID=A0AAW2KFY0_9LAMI
MIKVAAWNVRGLNGIDHQRAVENLVREHGIQFLGLIETRVNVANVQRIRSKFLTSWSWFEDYNGPAGRIWIAWCNLEIDVDILWVDNQIIHCQAMNKRTHTKCLISVLYGDCDLIPRRNLWATLHNLADNISEEPWLVLGDFNAVIDDSEVNGRAADTTASMTEFRNCIMTTGLIHLPFTGCPYSWHNCSEGSRSLWKRLDRMLVNEAWLDKWPDSAYLVALPSTSDHSPLIIQGGNREIKDAAFDIAEDSAPGPDGYTAGFFKASWSVVGKEVSEAVSEFFRTGKLLKQNAFVPGRSISDNILLAQELLAESTQSLISVSLEVQTNTGSMFADDVLVFCKADIPSITVIKDTLCEFAELSGRLFTCQVLRVPLSASRLTIADCKPLIDKLETRIAGWNHLNLTFAGRVQLIRSVLNTLHSYWASVFILPKGIIKILEAKGNSYGKAQRDVDMLK